jgi:hypothetical protein
MKNRGFGPECVAETHPNVSPLLRINRGVTLFQTDRATGGTAQNLRGVWGSRSCFRFVRLGVARHFADMPPCVGHQDAGVTPTHPTAGTAWSASACPRLVSAVRAFNRGAGVRATDDWLGTRTACFRPPWRSVRRCASAAQERLSRARNSASRLSAGAYSLDPPDSTPGHRSDGLCVRAKASRIRQRRVGREDGGVVREALIYPPGRLP